MLQHKSMVWHVDRMVRWSEDLGSRGGKKKGVVGVDPTVGTPRMEVRKFGRSYSHLLEMMLEHAQMEERILFPILDVDDPGISLLRVASEQINFILFFQKKLSVIFLFFQRLC